MTPSPSEYPPSAGRRVALAVFIAAASMVLLEIIFSKALLFLHLVGTPLTVIPVAFLGLALGATICLYARGPRLLVLAQAAFPWSLLLACATLLVSTDVLLITAMLALPFVCAGVVVAEGLRSQGLHAIYGADLLGAGSGVFALYFLLPRLGGELVLVLLFMLLGAVALILHPLAARRAVFASGVLVLLLGAAGAVLQTTGDRLNMLRLARQDLPFPDSFIGILQLRNPENRLLYTRWGLVARIDVIESHDDPIGGLFRGVPFPEDSDFARIVRDGGAPSVNLFYNDFFFTVVSKDHYFVQKHFTLLNRQPSVLIIGIGGGDDVMRARVAGATRVVGVEINPETVELMKGPLADVSKHVYDQVEVHVADGRSFVHETGEKFDVISLFFADLFVPFPGSNVFLENYLYTVEAFRDYLNALTPDGTLYIGKWMNNYVENVELFRITTTAWTALEEAGVEDPGKHLVVVGLDLSGGKDFNEKNAGFILMKKSPFTREEVDTILAASPPPYFPIYTPWQTGPTDIAKYFEAEDKQAFLASLASDVSPTRDDRPFFYEFDRAHALQGRLLRRLLFVIALVLGPPLLWYLWRHRSRHSGAHTLDVLYFALLGLAYGMLQISLVQRFNVFLGSPIYSMLTVLTSFLLFGGIGSLVSRRWSARTVATSTAAMLALFLAIHLAMPWIAALGAGLAYTERCLLLGVFLLVPCVLIGVPFPAYLRLSRSCEEGTVPFHYAVNSVSLVLGTLVSLYFSMVFGFSTLLVFSLLVYLFALVPLATLPRRIRS